MKKQTYVAGMAMLASLSVCHVQAATSVTVQENASGFCSADGDSSESKNSGYTGQGYVNVPNESGTNITWSINAASQGSYQLALRFANGGSNSRPGDLTIAGNRYTVSLASTGSWTSWKTETITVNLEAGQNIISLTATGSSGLANIDSITLTGGDVTPGSCNVTDPEPTPEPTPTPEPEPVDDPLVTGCKGETSGLSASTIYYVAPDGSSSANGTQFSSAMDFNTALSKVTAGEMILLEPGTYSIAYKAGTKNTIKFSKSGKAGEPITVVAANCGRAVFDFSFPDKEWVQNSFGFDLTGDYWYFKGIEVTRAGYQGVYVTGSHNTFENSAFHHNRNTGFEINKGGSYTTVINSDAYRNYDPKKNGSMADGFGPKQKQGPGNEFYGCRAWENSDDGFDLYDSPESVVIDKSWAFRNGIDYWNYGGFDGNGNGFKLGGNRALANNRITNSVAFGNVVKGFDQNNNAGGITVLNNISYANGTNYGFGNSLSSGEKHYFRNNVSLSGPVSISNADSMYNSWDTGPTASSSDFLSLDLSLATADRNPDGTLPETNLFKLAPGSLLIDAGTNVNMSYKGYAPDLGAFERE